MTCGGPPRAYTVSRSWAATDVPRLRTLKPSFFKNEELAELPPLTRLLFEGLWCLADREGRLEDRPARIKVEVLPYDRGNVDQMLQDLHDHGFILRYCVGGVRYIFVSQFSRHQSPHSKEAPSTIPAPDEHGALRHENTSKSTAPDEHGASTVFSGASTIVSAPSSDSGLLSSDSGLPDIGEWGFGGDASHAAPPAAPKRKRLEPSLTDEEHARLHEDFDIVLDGGSVVEETIALALGHKAARNYPNGPWYLYVRGWLRRDAERHHPAEVRANGKIAAAPGKYAEIDRQAREG